MITPKDAKKTYLKHFDERLSALIERIDKKLISEFRTSANVGWYNIEHGESDLIWDAIVHYEKLGWYVVLKGGEYGDYLKFHTHKPKHWWQRIFT